MKVTWLLRPQFAALTFTGRVRAGRWENYNAQRLASRWFVIVKHGRASCAFGRVRQRKRAARAGRDRHGHRGGGSRRFHLCAAIRAAPGDQCQSEGAAGMVGRSDNEASWSISTSSQSRSPPSCSGSTLFTRGKAAGQHIGRARAPSSLPYLPGGRLSSSIGRGFPPLPAVGGSPRR